MANNNSGVGHRPRLSSLSDFMNRPRRSPSVNTNIPHAGFATTSSTTTSTLSATSPQVTTPRTTALQATSPQANSPQTTTPQATALQTTPPLVTSPQAISPQATSQQATSPQATSPQATSPQATASKETAPQIDALPFRSPPTRRPAAVTPTVIGPPPPPYGSPAENKLALLEKYDTVFVIDDSISMQNHWEELQAILGNIAPICTKFDNDGIDIYFLNHQRRDEAGKLLDSPQPGKDRGGYNNIRATSDVGEIFSRIRPNGIITETGARLRGILRSYLRLYSEKLAEFRLVDKYSELDQKDMKPINIIVFTDGKADDDLKEEIIHNARELDVLGAPLNQVGIQFFRVGNVAGAAQYFQDLDDNIGEGVRDMVDTVTWDAIVRSPNSRPSLCLSAEGILKVVLGAVVRHLDRQETRSARERIGTRATRGESI